MVAYKSMAHFLILAGLAIGTAAYASRHAVRIMSTKTAKSQSSLVEEYKHAFEDPMSRKEAYLILGVSRSASEQEIQKAHRTLILLNHPDRGGSHYMASKINEAKDILINK
jgi:preprotein translocase subunit Sec63